MITTPYTAVLQLAVEMSGRTYPPSTEQAGFFKTFITHHLRAAWEAYAWPELCLPSQEYFAAIWRDQGVYNFGDFVFYTPTGKYYQMIRSGTVISIIGNTPLELPYWAEAAGPEPTYQLSEWSDIETYNVGDRVKWDGVAYQLCVAAPANTPPTDVEHWGRLVPFYRFVSKTLRADGLPRADIIGEFFGITEEDPRVVKQPTKVEYATMFQGSVGAQIYDALPYVWIYYRRTPPLIVADDAQIPVRLSEIVALRSASSMLRTDGKSDQANEFQALADAALQSELDKAVTAEQQRFGTEVLSR